MGLAFFFPITKNLISLGPKPNQNLQRKNSRHGTLTWYTNFPFAKLCTYLWYVL